MKLIIAEKPDLGRDIAKAITGEAKESNGCIVKGEYIVIWAYGHLLKLKSPEEYDDKYAKWNLADLPIFFNNWNVVPDPNKIDRVRQIGELLKRDDIECVINAGDPDDEGQLLIDEILRYFNYTGNVLRLDTGDTTTPSLQKSLANLKDNKPLESYGWSAYARSVADFTVGINLSRFFTINNMKKLSVGRVQTPTLGLVVKRDMIIENHNKVHYYELFPLIRIEDKSIECKYMLPKDSADLEDGKILQKEILEVKQKELNNKTFIGNITKKEIKEAPPLPFNLVKLQSYLGRKYKYSPTEVMEITQGLREKYHAITYNRSDCQYLTEEHFKQAPETVNRVLKNFNMDVPGINTSIKSKAFNDENITAHFAIIPTNNGIDLKQLTEKERNVYTAISEYYLVQFMQPISKRRTELIIEAPEGSKIKASSIEIIDSGYRNFLTDADEEAADQTSELSRLSAGDYQMSVEDGIIKEKETKPPARYTESTLNEDMTKISKYVKNPEIKKLLLEKDQDKKGENGSIGTSATRGAIIAGLISKGFLEHVDNKLISTKLGRAFYNILPAELTEPDMTAKWYVIQEDIKAGGNPNLLTENVLEVCKEIMSKEYQVIKRESVATCPICGSDMYEWPKSISCSNKECNFVLWKNIAGKKLTVETLRSLVENRRINNVKGFIGKTGKEFDAGLQLDLSAEAIETKRYVKFIFAKNAANSKKGKGKSKTVTLKI